MPSAVTGVCNSKNLHPTSIMPELSQYAESTEESLRLADAIVEDHFRLKSGRHSKVYVDKARLANYPGFLSRICGQLAFELKSRYGTDGYLLVAPEKGGIAVAQQIGAALATYKPENVVAITMPKAERGGFMFERGADNLFLETLEQNPCVILIEDIVTTGGSIVQVRQSVEDFCTQNGVNDMQFDVCTALVNRGAVTSFDIGIDHFFWMLSMDSVQTWDVDNGEECPLCAEGMPINQKLGHPLKEGAV